MDAPPTSWKEEIGEGGEKKGGYLHGLLGWRKRGGGGPEQILPSSAPTPRFSSSSAIDLYLDIFLLLTGARSVARGTWCRRCCCYMVSASPPFPSQEIGGGSVGGTELNREGVKRRRRRRVCFPSLGQLSLYPPFSSIAPRPFVGASFSSLTINLSPYLAVREEKREPCPDQARMGQKGAASTVMGAGEGGGGVKV